MDNLMLNKAESSEYYRSDDTNKRKRRCASTHSDESTRKKALHLEIQEDESATHITNSTENVAENKDQQAIIVNNEEDEDFNDTFMLEDLCDEILYEIFKYLDTWSLMSLMNVCKRFQKFVLDKRLWENIDLSQQPLPLGILEDKLERSHDKTKCIKLRGPSPCQHIEGEIQHFNKTIQNSFTTRCTKLITLELYGVTLDFNQITLKDFPQTLKRLVLNTCNVRVASHKSLFTGIDTILVNLEELAIEYNSWFDPYYVMALSKLPLLRYLSLRGCWQMQEFIPYGSIAARHGFKQLEILDLRDTPLNDSDLQCFNAVETLKEIYLQRPEDEPQNDVVNKPENEVPTKVISSDKEGPTTSNEQRQNREPSSSSSSSSPSTSKSSSKNGTTEEKAPLAATHSLLQNEPSTSSSTSSASSSSSSPASVSDNNSVSSTPIIVQLVGTNNPPRSRFLPRSDHILVDVRNRPLLNPLHVNNYENYLRLLQLPGQVPVIEQMMRHNLFWDIVNPLGRVVGAGGPDRLFGEENGAEQHMNMFSISPLRQQPRGSISDRGVCCFGRTRQPVQQGLIWIRFNNRPSENRFERFSVRDYKLVTDVSLQHLVQCSPHLIFLDVSGTSVTHDGLQRFKDLKPECKVVAEHLLGVAKGETTVS